LKLLAQHLLLLWMQAVLFEVKEAVAVAVGPWQ
jgi:hypothetical protein